MTDEELKKLQDSYNDTNPIMDSYAKKATSLSFPIQDSLDQSQQNNRLNLQNYLSPEQTQNITNYIDKPRYQGFDPTKDNMENFGKYLQSPEYMQHLVDSSKQLTDAAMSGGIGIGSISNIGKKAVPSLVESIAPKIEQALPESVKKILYKLKSNQGELNLNSEVGRASGRHIGTDEMEMMGGPEAVALGHERPFYIDGLEVNPNMQGQGYGSKMFKVMEDKAKRQGADSIMLNASPMGTNLQPRDPTKIKELVEFYKRLGLEPYLDEGGNVLMHKKILPNK